MQLINANGIYSKMRKSLGNKRNEFTDAQIEEIMNEYRAFPVESKISKVFDNEDFGYTTVKVCRPLLDENGEPICDKKGKPKANKDLNDTENIPLKEDIQEYMEREVLSYASDAWIESVKNKKTKQTEIGTVGYEIPFTRYFYEYTPLRPSTEILLEIKDLESQISDDLAKAGL